jgi:hypothetical protein
MPGIWFSREGNKNRTPGHILGGAIPISTEECFTLLKGKYHFFEEPPSINPEKGDRSWDNPSFVVVEIEHNLYERPDLGVGFYLLEGISPAQILNWLGDERIRPYWAPPVLTL